MAARQGRRDFGRRDFLAGAAATITIVKPSLVRGTQANSTIELGMIGCGGRGMWIAPLFLKNGNYRFVACADYYPMRVDKFGNEFKVDASHRYTTLSAHKKLLEQKLDAVVIETPPYFHPEHAAAAVEAGRHVYIAKPIAVDAPGCLSIAESGKRATAKKLVFLIDFQTRNNEFYREAARRVHAGAIGRLVTGEARYPAAGCAFPPALDPAERLAPTRWYCTRAISGDFIVEQSIHALDVATWFLDADPIKCFGTGGEHKTRPYGDIWDHFNLIYWFRDDFVLSFYSVQAVPDCPSEIHCRIYGADGVVDTDYYSHVWIKGKQPYDGGTYNNLFTSGSINNVKDFYRYVTEGNCSNETVAPSVRSNLTAILGRDAAYKGGMLTWDEMMKAKARMEPDLRGLQS